MTTASFLADLFARRGKRRLGWTPLHAIELYGGTLIEPTAFPPNAATHPSDYYYNATTNTLYKKVVTRTAPLVAHWQKAST